LPAVLGVSGLNMRVTSVVFNVVELVKALSYLVIKLVRLEAASRLHPLLHMDVVRDRALEGLKLVLIYNMLFDFLDASG
jgi:hypothetical protein